MTFKVFNLTCSALLPTIPSICSDLFGHTSYVCTPLAWLIENTSVKQKTKKSPNHTKSFLVPWCVRKHLQSYDIMSKPGPHTYKPTPHRANIPIFQIYHQQAFGFPFNFMTIVCQTSRKELYKVFTNLLIHTWLLLGPLFTFQQGMCLIIGVVEQLCFYYKVHVLLHILS